MSTPIALEIFLGFGVPIAWGLWELHMLRREKVKDQEKARVESVNAAAQAALTPAAASGTATTSEPTAR